LAPLRLVQAVASTTSLFVFLFGVFLSIIASGFTAEELSTAKLTQKAASAIFAVTGVKPIINNRPRDQMTRSCHVINDAALRFLHG
jgi:hypothetical protein